MEAEGFGDAGLEVGEGFEGGVGWYCCCCCR